MNVRRQVFLTGVALLFSAAASAQSTAPAQSQPRPQSDIDDWTGLYAGANLGHVSQAFTGQVSFPSTVNSTGPLNALDLGALSAGSATVGIQAGYGLRLTRDLVGGLEVQLTHTSPFAIGPSGSATAPADQATVQGGLATSIRARAGTTLMRGLFVYGTIGAAITRVTAQGAITTPPATALVANSTATQTMKGVTLGIGGEYAPWKYGTLERVTIGVEFRHAPLGTQTFTFGTASVQPAIVLQPATATITSHTNEFDVRVNYRFSIKRSLPPR